MLDGEEMLLPVDVIEPESPSPDVGSSYLQSLRVSFSEFRARHTDLKNRPEIARRTRG